MQRSPQFSSTTAGSTSSTSNVQSSAPQQTGNRIVSGLKDSPALATPQAGARSVSVGDAKDKVRLNGELLNAVQAGDVIAVERLLDKGADMEAKDTSGSTALMYAASSGHIDVIRVLVNAGADVRFGGDEALRVAAIKGRADVARLLIDKGVAVTGKAAAGESTLRVAIEHGHADVVQLLIEKGVDLSVVGKTLLAKAAALGHVRIVQLLIQAKVDVKNTEVATALLEIGKHGYTEVLQVLIDAGFDVKNSYGFSGPALMSAATNGHTQTVRLFIKHGVITAEALPVAAENGHLDVVQALLEESLVKENQPAIKAALQAAKKKGHTAITELLEGIVGSSSSVPAEPSWVLKDLQCSEQAFKAAEAGDVQRVFDCLWKVSDQRRGDVEEKCKAIWQKNKKLLYVKQLVRLMAEAERKQQLIEGLEWSEQAFKAAEAGDVQRAFDCLWKVSDQCRGDAEEQCMAIAEANDDFWFVAQLDEKMAAVERKQQPVEFDGEWMDALPEWNEDGFLELSATSR